MKVIDYTLEKSKNKKIHLFFPPCAGLYHYWFGAIKALQDILTEEELNHIHFHTVSGSGFPVAALVNNFDVENVYKLWGIRFNYLFFRGGWGFLYYLIDTHLISFLKSASSCVNLSNIRHSCYCTDFPFFKFYTLEYDTVHEYSSLLTASSLIPLITFRQLIFYKRRFIFDGNINSIFTRKSPYQNVQKLLNYTNITDCGEILNYKSVKYNNFWFIFGLFLGNQPILFDAGYADMFRNIDKIYCNRSCKRDRKHFNSLEECFKDGKDIILYGNKVYCALLLISYLTFQKYSIKIMK